MLTTYEERELIFDSLRAGASGYMLKNTLRSELLQAVEQVEAAAPPCRCRDRGRLRRLLPGATFRRVGCRESHRTRAGNPHATGQGPAIQGNCRQRWREAGNRSLTHQTHLRQAARGVQEANVRYLAKARDKIRSSGLYSRPNALRPNIAVAGSVRSILRWRRYVVLQRGRRVAASRQASCFDLLAHIVDQDAVDELGGGVSMSRLSVWAESLSKRAPSVGS